MLNLSEILVRPVRSIEELSFQQLMQEHHYLGALPKISETLWYVSHLCRSMGRSSEFFRRRPKVFSTGSVDRMGLSPSLRSAKTADQ